MWKACALLVSVYYASEKAKDCLWRELCAEFPWKHKMPEASFIEAGVYSADEMETGIASILSRVQKQSLRHCLTFSLR